MPVWELPYPKRVSSLLKTKLQTTCSLVPQFIKAVSCRPKMENGGAYPCRISMLWGVPHPFRLSHGLTDGLTSDWKRIWGVHRAHGLNPIILPPSLEHLMTDVTTSTRRH